MQTISNEVICKCIHCQQPLNVYFQFNRLTGECKNTRCRRVHITMDVEALQTLSNADLDHLEYPDYSISANR